MPKKYTLNTWAITMINIIAIDNLRSPAFSAKFGTHLIGYYFLAAVLFFLPVCLICAELASRYPEKGGIYVWIKRGLGKEIAFFTIWIQWIYNVIWFPSLMIFVWAILTHMLDSPFLYHPVVTLVGMVSIFWLCTLFNCYGMQVSSRISTIGVIIGTLIPMTIICVLAFFDPPNIGFQITMSDFIPDFTANNETFPYFVELIFGLVGIEISAAHADEVKNPSSTYPKATFISIIIILATLIFSGLAIAKMVPTEQLSVLSGIMQAAKIFFTNNHMTWFYPIFGCMVMIGSLSCLTTWIIGITKGIFVASQDRFLPDFLSKENQYKAPYIILIIQALIFTLLSTSILLLPIEVAFVLLTAVTTQLSLLIYIILFITAYCLKHHRPNTQYFKTPYLGLVCTIGGLTSIGVFIIGFFIPLELGYHSPLFYSLIICCILILAMLPPVLGIVHSRRYAEE
ncbi:MAG: amino acid permease [Legionellales bacterium]|nr:amino acid permease [Legionellales bacterium]